MLYYYPQRRFLKPRLKVTNSVTFFNDPSNGYPFYVHGPLHATLMYESYKGDLDGSRVEFRVVNSYHFDVLQDVQNFLVDPEYDFHSINEDHFKLDKGVLILTINDQNLKDVMQFWLNYVPISNIKS